MAEDQVTANKREIILGKCLFKFTSFDDWCNTATRKFGNWGLLGRATHLTVCIDTKGRICTSGKQFMRARDEEAFPIEVYLIDSDGGVVNG